jgi:hypothetical protein
VEWGVFHWVAKVRFHWGGGGGERIDKDERFERGGRERKRKFAVVFCPLSNQHQTVETQ